MLDFPPFDEFLIIVSMGKKLFMYKYKRKSNATLKGKQRDNVKKVKFTHFQLLLVEISIPKNQKELA